MKDVYEILNNSTTKLDHIDKVDLTEMEKKRIYRTITGAKKKSVQRTAAAVAIMVCVGAMAVPATAGILHYMNGNTRIDYVEQINETVPGMKADTESTEGAIKENGTTMEVQQIGRDGTDIKMTLKFTFDRDISELVQACEAEDVPQGNVLDTVPFQNSTIVVDGWDMRQGEDEQKNPNPFFFQVKNESVEGNVLIQKIEISMDDNRVDPESVHDISLCYADIVLNDGTIEGEWKYEYSLDSSVYGQEDIATADMEIQGTSVEGNEYTLDRYAVTPNGIKIYGTSKEMDIDFDTVSYPLETSTIRIFAEDDLGNQYLLYPMYPDYDPDAESNEAVYELYNGPAVTLEGEDKYQTELAEDATSLTVTLQQEIGVWNSSTELGGERYEFCSDPFTIQLK